MKACLALLCVVSSFPLVIGCTQSADPRRVTPSGSDRILSSMGFALVDDGDPATAAGDLNATFDSPVIDAAEQSFSAGTAHVAFDDDARDVQSATVIGAYPETDIVYTVLYDELAPWRYVVVGAHAGDLSAGADLALDGDNAAAIVVDESTGSGFVSTSGTFHVDSADVAVGGRVTGTLSCGLVEVGLSSWPEQLFPFSSEPSEVVSGTASGTFSAVYSWQQSGAAGTASVDVAVDGLAPFHGSLAQGMLVDPETTALVIFDDEGRRVFAVIVPTADLVAGTTVALGFDGGAELLEEDGSAVLFTGGTLTLDAVSLDEGGVISGSIDVSGEAWIVPADEGFVGEGEGEGEDCSALPTLAETFTPTAVYVEENIPPEEMPPGYDTMLTFSDEAAGMFGLLVPTDADLHTGVDLAFSTVDFEGQSFPAAMMAVATCGEMVFVDGGTLDAALDASGTRLLGTLSYTANGQSRTVELDIPTVQ